MEQFVQWFAGFVDGEGNFQVWSDRSYIRVAFRITLHIDDIDTLYFIQKMLNVGSVTYYPNSNSAVYLVSDMNSLFSIVIPVLLQHGLLTIKQLDLLDFRTVLLLIRAAGTYRLTGNDLEQAIMIMKNMNSGRTETAKTCPNAASWYYVLGFFEAEGTAGLCFGQPYLEVAQHDRSLGVLLMIHGILQTVVETGKIISLTHNKNTNVWSVSITGVDTFFPLLTHLLDMPWVTRKTIDVHLWSIVVVMFYTGVAYLPAGRALIVSISAYINDGRYSTASRIVEVPSLAMINHVLSITVPVTRAAGITQVEFAKAIVRQLGVTVYVYANEELMGSYKSFSDAQYAIGIKRTSRIASRYLDTGRLYIGTYEFTSTPKDRVRVVL
jgi:hypothetical protein